MTNYSDLEFALIDNLNSLNPEILDNLEYYRVQDLIDKLNNKIKMSNDKTKAQNKEYLNQQNQNNFKQPKLPNMKLPKMK